MHLDPIAPGAYVPATLDECLSSAFSSAFLAARFTPPKLSDAERDAHINLRRSEFAMVDIGLVEKLVGLFDKVDLEREAKGEQPVQSWLSLHLRDRLRCDKDAEAVGGGAHGADHMDTEATAPMDTTITGAGGDAEGAGATGGVGDRLEAAQLQAVMAASVHDGGGGEGATGRPSAMAAEEEPSVTSLASRCCVVCAVDVAKSEYSKNQWKKGPGRSLCKECVRL
mmetsp:Transcript_99782/g.285297  ORF Transcript_99782/g.285297 Transcript_99782/m.285297 type:complete len:225 (-) Transcript_99782:174-848(-)